MWSSDGPWGVRRLLDYFPLKRHFRAMKQYSRGASPAPNFAIPDECRKAAETLFPSGDHSPARDQAAVTDFARVLGIGAEYRRLTKVDRDTEEMRKFLGHFQNNLDLLIQKTWVEKTDEARKEKLQDRVPAFMDLIMRGDFRRAIEEFGEILDGLAYLLFGKRSADDDFAEYTFRIDIEMGLFWWYGSRLRDQEATDDPGDDEYLWALLLVGICYLTNF